MKRILITGSSGFIGSFLVEEALNRNYEVFAGIRKSSSKAFLQDQRIKFIEFDFSDTASLNKLIAETPAFDYIIHNAGVTKAARRSDYFTANYLYTRNFVEALITQHKVPRKFIYISSLAAYGPGDASSLSPVKATDIPRPVTAYGESKLKAEQYFLSLTDFPYILIRPTAVYGPREKDLLTVFKMINNNTELFVGLKKQYLTFIYVRDLVKAIFMSMESPVQNKGYFVTDGNVYNASMFGSLIKTELGKKTIRIKIPAFIARCVASLTELSKYFTGKQPVLNLDKINELEAVNWKCDFQPLRDDVHFMPDYDLKKGITETTLWYKKSGWL